jgi:hypothetical protein
MRELEQLLGLFVAAVILAAAARRAGAPYPVFLALGGALLALSVAIEGALHAALASLAGDRSPIAEIIRQELTARLTYEATGPESRGKRPVMYRREFIRPCNPSRQVEQITVCVSYSKSARNSAGAISTVRRNGLDSCIHD